MRKKPRRRVVHPTRSIPHNLQARRPLGSIQYAGPYPIREGVLPEPKSDVRCPNEMANIENRYCIDRWEASLVEVLNNGQLRDWPPFGPIRDEHRLRAVSKPDVYPQGYISGVQAEKACEEAGKRLCSPIEWRNACVGSRAMTYGYGSEHEARRCNDYGRSPIPHFYPQVHISWALVGINEMNDPQLNQLNGGLARTGAHPQCTNDYGVYDMVGNLHEWTSDPNGTFQGGYYLDNHENGDGCSYRTAAHDFGYHDYSTGFRCCADPTDASSGEDLDTQVNEGR